MPTAMRYYKYKNDRSSAINICVVRVMQKYKKWNDKIPFDLWVRRMFINLAIDEYRKGKKNPINNNELYEIPKTYSEENIGLNKLNKDAILALIDKLPEMQKNVFNLTAIDGYSHAEVAKLFEISISNSRFYLFDARKKLQKAISLGSLKNNLNE